MIKSFALRAIAWVMLLLIAWYWVAAWITPSLSVMAGFLMHAIFPDWVNGAGWNQTAAVLFTDLPLSSVGEISAQRFEAVAGVLQLGLGLPLYMALLLASRARHVFWKILAGVLILLPFLMWSICFTWLRQVLTLRGAYSVMELGFSPWQVSLIALADQLAKLIFPVLAPVLIWLAFERRFAEDVFLQRNNSQQ
jgi:hypothetical protein